ncbi:DUF1593 domain-containing protein [Stieleria sp. ICT_E10.1]|uniref:DUF1593 domain-containing protein n=1 Tax=Stieleria sedimenti TaxID=2976331 RepID=UPI00218090F2|nr:nucleoside hydrolase-like domain-containing protein [Stieleria sedimenti]MCS7468627.1 DUF1593 domain-containing protein [Stieleria sedimenti]
MSTQSFAESLKPRMLVLTDISTWETDDHESLIRLLAHADMFEIEGIVISTGYSIRTLNKEPERGFIHIARGVVDAYEKDLPNLMKRSGQTGHAHDGNKQKVGYWPSPDYLRKRIMFGSMNRGKQFIGDDNGSPGCELLIKQADEADERPLWIGIWGGGNTLAQAIYEVKKERSEDDYKKFLRKLRAYAITDQDRHYRGENHDISSHGWIYEQTRDELLFIWDEAAWKQHNEIGKSNWNEYAKHIQGHGHMGSQYPKYKYGVEGDTPAFLYLMPNGLNDPEDPTQASWGGNFVKRENGVWREAKSCVSNFKRTYPAAFNNFAARMDWAKDGHGNRNPKLVVDGDDGIKVIHKDAAPGASVTLDASKTTDPDGDKLTFNWWVQPDAGNYGGKVVITGADSHTATIQIPTDAAGRQFHVICEVTDNGTHNLSSYRRVVFHLSGGRVDTEATDDNANRSQPAAKSSAPTDGNTTGVNAKSLRPRIIVMSDFPPIGVVKGGNVPNTMKSDPDDMQSMVRFLLYSNEFDVEGIVAAAGTFAMEAHKKNMLDVLDRYEQVYGNLKSHDARYPTPDYLRSVTYEGRGNNHGLSIKFGKNKQPWSDIIGKGLDTEASNAIIAAVDKPDPRPVWISVWGGPREVSQAIWDVKNNRSKAELKRFISKLRIFLIYYQDSTHGWLMDEFPELFIVDSRKTYQGMFGGRDPLSDLAWVNEHVRKGHGLLCDIYPHEGMGCTGVCEGDTPAFLHLVSATRGINDAEDPTQPSWGGQYKRRPGTNHYVDGPGKSSISRWRADYQKEFQDRCDWCVTPHQTSVKR